MDIQSLTSVRGAWLENLAKGTATAEGWGDWKWHLSHRIDARNMEEFLAFFPEYKANEALLFQHAKSFDFGVLPLNALQPEGVRKFLPTLSPNRQADPYGVQRDYSVVLREASDGGKPWYIATHKPGYSSFLPIM